MGPYVNVTTLLQSGFVSDTLWIIAIQLGSNPSRGMGTVHVVKAKTAQTNITNTQSIKTSGLNFFNK
jgi:CRISPR/Cas system CSM-associated protein Csm3 (group 7 of RAMP superfamily)